MADLGKLKIDPNEAINKAATIRSCANRIHETLNSISMRMNQIDDEGEGIYQGTAKSSELKADLQEIKANFEPIYQQIMSFASQIDNAAKLALKE